jgi:tetratricopeptide (TPR) repeat protein
MRTLETITKQSNKPSYQDSLEFAYQRMGDMFLVAGHAEQSLAYYRKQLKTNTNLVVADPKSMTYRTSLSASDATYGHALWRAGHVAEGLTWFRRGLTELAESKQHDSRALGLEATLHLWMAGALEKQGDVASALHSYLAADSYYARVCESDPKDVEDCLGLAGTQDRMARIHVQQGHADEARAEYQKALAITEPLAAGDKPNLEAIYAAVNLYYGMGEVNRATHRTSCDWYAKSYAAFRRIPEWLPITPNEFDSLDPKQIRARLSSCPPASDGRSR